MAANEQRNAYKGDPARPWVQVRLVEGHGTPHELVLIVDTGNPFPVIISDAEMGKLKLRSAPDVNTNFGDLQGAWVRLQMPELGIDTDLIAYASDAIVDSTKTSHGDFQGLAGLPFLRMLEYGGDAASFWIRNI